jgi:hypothetical protein
VSRQSQTKRWPCYADLYRQSFIPAFDPINQKSAQSNARLFDQLIRKGRDRKRDGQDAGEDDNHASAPSQDLAREELWGPMIQGVNHKREKKYVGEVHAVGDLPQIARERVDEESLWPNQKRQLQGNEGE